MKLEATTRTAGKNAALRQEGILPAVIYNKEVNFPVAIGAKAFDRVFRQQGMSSLIDMEVEGESHQVLVREVQMDKRKRVPLHVDFYAITAGQKVEVAVPIVYEGTAAGENEGGQLDVQRREISIYVLPSQIPHDLSVDISELTIGDSIHISDVAASLPETAEILDDEGLTLITVLAPRAEIEEEEEVTDELEPEVIGRGGEEDEFDGESEGEEASDED